MVNNIKNIFNQGITLDSKLNASIDTVTNIDILIGTKDALDLSPYFYQRYDELQRKIIQTNTMTTMVR